jgi:hypothetical protein
MTTYIGLLRGINVGGNKMVAMADLRELTTGPTDGLDASAQRLPAASQWREADPVACASRFHLAPSHQAASRRVLRFGASSHPVVVKRL